MAQKRATSDEGGRLTLEIRIMVHTKKRSFSLKMYKSKVDNFILSIYHFLQILSLFNFPFSGNRRMMSCLLMDSSIRNLDFMIKIIIMMIFATRKCW